MINKIIEKLQSEQKFLTELIKQYEKRIKQLTPISNAYAKYNHPDYLEYEDLKKSISSFNSRLLTIKWTLAMIEKEVDIHLAEKFKTKLKRKGK